MRQEPVDGQDPEDFGLAIRSSWPNSAPITSAVVSSGTARGSSAGAPTKRRRIARLIKFGVEVRGIRRGPARGGAEPRSPVALPQRKKERWRIEIPIPAPPNPSIKGAKLRYSGNPVRQTRSLSHGADWRFYSVARISSTFGPTFARRDGVFEAPQGISSTQAFLRGRASASLSLRVTLGRQPEDVRVLLGRRGAGFLGHGLIPQDWNCGA